MKKNIFNELIKVYSNKMAYAILRGERNPSLKAIVLIEESLDIPTKAWLDIKSYLKNNTKNNSKKSNLKINKEVS